MPLADGRTVDNKIDVKPLRTRTKVLWGGIAIFALVSSLALLWVSNHYVAPIVMYHHIAEVSDYQPNWVSPRNFETQLQFLSDKKYNVVSMDELVGKIANHQDIPRDTVVLTFDDGNDDNYTVAYPLLKKYGFPAIFFVASEDIGKEGFLTESQIREMIDNGMDIGSHTKTQAYLPDLPYEAQREEIFESKQKLEEMFGVPIHYIAYPIGGFSEGIKELVKEAGYKAAVTTNRGYNKKNKDLFELKRIRFSDRNNSDFDLIVKLSGYYTTFKSPKKPF